MHYLADLIVLDM